MAVDYIDLSKEIKDWKDAELGEEVRAANVSAFEKIQTSVNQAVQSVNQASQDVVDASEAVKDAVEYTNQTTNAYKSYADEKLNQTEEQRKLAEKAQEDAEKSAELSKSWAVGGTGTREEENTNNAKYHSDQSKSQADRAKNEADRAEAYSKIVAPGFYFDVETSTLYMKTGAGVDFVLDGATLYWKITA